MPQKKLSIADFFTPPEHPIYDFDFDEDDSGLEHIEESTSTDIQQYVGSLNDPGEMSYQGFLQSGFNTEADLPKSKYTNVVNYLRNSGKIPRGTGASRAAATPAAEPAAPVRPAADPKTYSSALQNLVMEAAEADEVITSLGDRVEAKYHRIEQIVTQIVLDHSPVQHAFIYGQAGVGKTYSVKKAIKETLPSTQKKYKYVRGSIGKSPTDVLLFLYQHRSNYVIILDDCDSFLLDGSQEVQLIMKGALDSDNPTVHIGEQVRKKMAATLGINTKKEKDPEDEEGSEDDASSKEEDLPDEFYFDSSIIFISNLSRDKLDQAVMSRCVTYNMNLTSEEFIWKLKQVLPSLRPERNKMDVRTYDWAKKCCFMYLMTAVEAAEKGAPLGGQYVTIRVPLQFRMVSDLIIFWMIACGEAQDKYGLEDIVDQEKKAAWPFVRDTVIPVLEGKTDITA